MRTLSSPWFVSSVLLLVCFAGLQADPSDPFSRENRAKPKLSPVSQKIATLISFKVAVEPPKAKPGEVVRLVITGTPNEGYHTYPLTKRTPTQNLGSLSSITLEETPGLVPLGPYQESEPEFVLTQVKENEVDLEHTKPFTWAQDIYIAPDSKPGLKKFDVTIRLQVCAKSCYGPDIYPPLEAAVEVLQGSAKEPSKELAKRLEEKMPPVQVVSASKEVLEKLNREVAKNKQVPGAPKAGDPREDLQNLWALLGAAFGGAFLMLLTPCVFPMIPITVNFFLKQSEKEHYNPVLMASVYSGTIVFVLMMAMFALGTLVITWANNPWFNLVFGLVLIVFALSLFGMFELELPNFLARYTSAHESQGGLLGAVFMAMTFTITSFTCTGPFLGLMLAPVAGIKPPLPYLILAALVYSATFAAPFFFLALFPRLLKSLPKSGGWLNTVKVTMGFLEIGAALKFLSIADYVLFPGNPRLFTFDAVMCGWIALSLACGLYLLGLFRLPHDDAPEHVGVLRMMFATIFIGLAVYLAPALFGGKPTGVIGENIVAFAPPRLNNHSAGAGKSAEALAWNRKYEEAWKEAVQKKNKIFIDFTGINCQNCRFNEENVLTRQDVVTELKKYTLVQLYTDSVPDPSLSSGQAEELARQYAKWRDKLANTAANPTYVILEPDQQSPFDESGNLKGKFLGFRDGQIFNTGDFLNFLRQQNATGVSQLKSTQNVASLAASERSTLPE